MSLSYAQLLIIVQLKPYIAQNLENVCDHLASFPGFPSSFPSLARDGKLEGKPGNEASDHLPMDSTFPFSAASECQ